MDFRLAVALALPVIAASMLPAMAATTTIIYDFGASSTDAANPSGGLAIDSNGNLYGATQGGGVGGSGTVSELTPPANGQSAWTETVLHSFSADREDFDGVRPQGSVLLAPDGSLFGTTSAGGGPNDNGAGTVYHLVPPAQAGGNWTNQTLYVFPTNKINLGAEPTTGVVMDQAGNVYGTTPEQGATKLSDVVTGTVYELTPSSGSKTGFSFVTLYDFGKAMGRTTSPVSAPVQDSNGNLYFTVLIASTSAAAQCEIARLSPPAGGQGDWTFTSLYRLPSKYGQPVGDLSIDGSGALYGSTIALGTETVSTAYRLTPPAGQTSWTASILAVLPSTVLPMSGLALTSGGQVYGNARGGSGKHAAGVTYQLTPPADSGRWTYTVLHAFVSKPGADGQDPVGTPAVGSGGALFGATIGGGTGDGTAFQIVP